jgi:hypothetical protein
MFLAECLVVHQKIATHQTRDSPTGAPVQIAIQAEAQIALAVMATLNRVTTERANQPGRKLKSK